MSASTFIRGLLCLLLLGTAATAAGPKAISKVPFEIKTPGRYVLSRNVTLTAPVVSAAILISSDDVVLDLGDSIITCDPTLGVTTDVAGVRADNRKNLTIRNGTVRGFARGIYLEGTDATGGHLVEDIHADRCTFLGIQVKGIASIVKNNRVSSVGGATFFSSVRYGIFANGTGIRLLDNDIHGVAASTGSADAFGLYLEASNGASVADNRVANSAAPASGGGRVIGIYVFASSLSVSGNYLAYWKTGFVALGSGGNASPPGVYRDNTAIQCDIDYSGSTFTNGGGNN